MRLINSLADRVLGVVVPKTTAGACVPPDSWTQYCSCTSHVVKTKQCHYGCTGNPVCGSCTNTNIEC
jgi:hypothetical protein